MCLILKHTSLAQYGTFTCQLASQQSVGNSWFVHILHRFIRSVYRAQGQCKPNADSLLYAEVQPVLARFCVQSY